MPFTPEEELTVCSCFCVESFTLGEIELSFKFNEEIQEFITKDKDGNEWKEMTVYYKKDKK